jgi:hypothetical protein
MGAGDEIVPADKAEAAANGRTLEDISDRLEEMQRALSERVSLIPPSELEPPEATP